MKKVFATLVMLLLLAGTAAAFQREPLGWKGWSWGTKLNDVAGWLNYEDPIESERSEVVIDVFSRQGDTKYKIGMDPETPLYVFLDGTFVGILCFIDVDYDYSFFYGSPNGLIEEYGEPAGDYTLEDGARHMFWDGKFSNIYAYYMPASEGDKAMTSLAIGTMDFMDAFAKVMFGYPMSWVRTAFALKLLQQSKP